MRWFSLPAAVTLACCLTLGIAHADSDTAKPAPRTVIQIGDASVVLIAANDHLYAFVDRIEDNAPLPDAELSIDSADGTSLKISRTTEGLFVAPFNRAGHMHDAFMVSLRSPEATGDAPAEIAYDDLPESSSSEIKAGMPSKLWIALVSGGIGALASVLVMLWLRGSRRRASAAAVGTAHLA